jgi:hypothetical protein
MSRILAPFTIALCAFACVIGTTLAVGASLAQAEAPGLVCYEDEPCFDWTAMGNGKRGIVLVTGRRIVVGTCRYQRLYNAGRINLKRTPWIKGDGWAIRYGCGFDVLAY